MYVPRHFAVTDPPLIRELMRDHPFATLVTTVEGRPIASHLPFALSDIADELVLSGHMARANEQWQSFRPESEVLVIFRGAHTYVSPRFYSKRSVPTWNYSAIHVYGLPEIISEQDELYTLLSLLVDQHESSQAGGAPFRLGDIPEDSVEGMMGGIVGFRIRVTKVQASYKLSQNRSEEDRKGVVIGLRERVDDDSHAVADAMERFSRGKPNHEDAPPEVTGGEYRFGSGR